MTYADPNECPQRKTGLRLVLAKIHWKVFKLSSTTPEIVERQLWIVFK